jgi:hypothetical protein
MADQHQATYETDATNEPRICEVCGITFRPKQRRVVAKYCSQTCKWRAPTIRVARLLRDYGMTLADYDAMLTRQNGGCALCGIKPEDQAARYTKYLHIDHDHKTGKVRGLLCAEHNLMLGRWHDSATELRTAADYLEAA